MPASRIVIRHLGGSKVNQVEQFPLDAFAEVTIGRDPQMTVAYDGQRDDAVSRRHAVIKVGAGEPPTFRISDLGSSNGTWLNGRRISAESELLPGDSVELGSGGPKFTFDVEPRPPGLAARTRMMNAAGAGGATTATRMIDAAGAAAPGGSDSRPGATTAETKPMVGRNTVMRMLSEQGARQSRTAIYALAAVIVVIGLVAGGIYYKSQRDMAAQKAAEDAALAQKAAQLEEASAKKAEQVQAQIGLSPEQIAAQFGNATVLITVQWRLYDRETGRPLFHKTVNFKGHLLPAYVKLSSGKIVRWLTSEDELHSNLRVGGEGNGTGFVINEQGLIFTNKHVASAWRINYNAFAGYERGQGVLYYEQPRFWNDSDDRQAKDHAAWLQSHQPVAFQLDSKDRADFSEAVSWQPEDGGPLFADGAPVIVGAGSHVFEGRNEELLVRFPNTRVDIDARLVRASGDADAALIKIDPTEALSSVRIAQGDTVNVGEKVVCLGYPAFSEKNVAVIQTRENAESRKQVEVIPTPTVTPGYITNIGLPQRDVGNVTIINTMGHVYQMSLPSGPGNSGGPVFNDKGDVIGLFTYANVENQTVTYAVPIKYARDLLAMQQK